MKYECCIVKCREWIDFADGSCGARSGAEMHKNKGWATDENGWKRINAKCFGWVVRCQTLVAYTGRVRGVAMSCRHVIFLNLGKNAGHKIAGATFLESFWRGEVGQDAVGILNRAKRSWIEPILFHFLG